MTDNQGWGTASYRPTPPGRVHVLREYLGAAEGARAKLGVLRVLAAGRLSKGPQASVAVVFRGMGGTPLHLRPGTTDLINATAYLARRIYDPPPEVTELRRVVELGSNMGAGLAALAAQNPEAELVGVEPDPRNIEAARRNLTPFGNRVRTIHAAAWPRDRMLAVAPDESAGAHGLTVQESTDDDGSGPPPLRGRTIDSLLAEAFPDGEIVDYMHVTIEGSERAVFAAGGDWPLRVRSLRVEVHPYFDYLTEECIGQLEELGFTARPVISPPDKWVFAVRDDLMQTG